MSEIKIVRLTSGEELISKVTVNKDSYLLEDAGVIIPVGEGKIGIAPWLPYAETDEGVTISNQFVVFVVDAHEDFKTQYEMGFLPSLSGLVAPQKKLVMPEIKLAD